MSFYSTTTFLNETHLLDLKVAEESPVVDKIFVVESDLTFTSNKKELLLENYTHPKVEVISLKNKLIHKDPWKNEAFQRNASMREFEDDDVILIADIDEIFCTEDLPKIYEETKKYQIVRLNQDLYRFYLNLKCENSWTVACAVTGKYLREGLKCADFPNLRLNFNGVRRLSCPTKVIETSGKHFSYLYSPENIKYKLKSFSHTELNTDKFLNNIEKSIENQVDLFDPEGKRLRKVEIDEGYPKTILNNLDKWKEWIL